MVKSFGLARKKGSYAKRKRTSRVKTYRRTRPTIYKAMPGLNVSNPRYFPKLPTHFNVKTEWQADTRYTMDLGGNGNVTQCSYVFLDPLDIGRLICDDGTLQVANRSWFSSDTAGFFGLYQEGRFRTHVLNYDFVADYVKQFQAGATAQAIGSSSLPSMEICVAAVPLTFLRTSTGAAHTIVEAGNFYSGVDYVSSLTKEAGVKYHSISADGSGRKATGSISMDAYDHNGEPQSMVSTATWTQNNQRPTLTYVPPNPDRRSVFLIAFRYRYLGLPGSLLQSLTARAAFRLDQHMTFLDRVPSFPYVTTGVA